MTVTDLLGRTTELGHLLDLLDEVNKGSQRVALVSGDPGIGKTTLVEALVARSGTWALWGRCWEGGGTPPFWPWVQVLRACIDECGDEVLEWAGPGHEHVERLLSARPASGPEGHRPAPEAHDERIPLYDAVAAVLTAAAERSPLIVALDDLHAADEGSLQLLRHLARDVRRAPLLLVGTYREAEVAASPPHQLALGSVSRHAFTIALRGLDLDDVTRLLQRSGTAVDAAVARQVYDATDGNPFLVWEAGRLLARSNGNEVPALAGAHALVRTRLDLLSPEAREVLAVAAVLGRTFALGELAQVLQRPPDDVIDVLSTAARLGVIEEARLGSWSFGHSLLREALLADHDPAYRAALHRRAAEVVETLEGVDEVAQVTRVAHHWFEAAQVHPEPKAVDACVRAADRAFAALAVEEAAAWYERALQLLDVLGSTGDQRHYDLLMALVDALLMTDVRKAVEATHRAIKVARAMGRIDLVAEAVIPVAPAAMSDTTLIGALDDALCELPETDSPLRAKVLVTFARLLNNSTFDPDVIRQISRQGLEMARRVGDPETLWTVLWQWHQDAQLDVTTIEERRAVAEELMELAARTAVPRRLVLAFSWRFFDRFQAGDVEGARADVELAEQDARRIGQPFLRWIVLNAKALLAFHDGDLATAERLSADARAASVESAWQNTELGYEFERLELYRHQGRFAELEQLARENLRTWSVTHLNPRFHNFVVALVETGRIDEARQFAEAALTGGWWERLVSGQIPTLRFLGLPALVAEVVWVTRDKARAAPLYDALLPHAHRLIFGQFPMATGARYLGLLATLLERYEEADAHFRQAHELHDRLGAGLWGPVTRMDHARMLLQRDGPGDRTRARELLEAAREGFRRKDLRFYDGRTTELLASLTAPPADRPAFTQEGEYWCVRFGDRSIRVPDSKGMRYLARLLANPGQEVHALELVGASPEESMAAGDAGEVLDAAAKSAYRRRLEQLRAAGDSASRAVGEEIEFLEAELSGAVGLGGRGRRAASDAERARQSVTRAVKNAIERLEEADPVLGDHLRTAVQTGTFLSYRK